MTKKSNKRALLMSVLSLLLCCAMLVGSTFAWFSDTAKTGDITITAGNLDVDIVDEHGDSIADKSPSVSLFRELDGFKWEPGAMWTSDTFKVKNLGNLALWYSLTLKATDVKKSGDKSLLDVVKMKIVDTTVLDVPADDDGSGKEDPSAQAKRAEFWKKIETTEGAEVTTGELTTKGQTTNSLVVVLYWEPDPSTAPENNDNKYNLSAKDYGTDGENALSAKFSLNVFATQTPFESDDFGKYYDDEARGGKFLEAMKDAVDDLISGEELKGKNVTIEFAVNEETGNPELTVTPTNGEGGTGSLEDSYGAVKSAISKALEAEKENISSVSIGGFVTTEYDEESLEEALVQWLVKEMGLTLNEEGAIDASDTAGLKSWAENLETNSYKMNIPVIVTDTNGAAVTYDTIIDVKAYESLIQALVSALGD